MALFDIPSDAFNNPLIASVRINYMKVSILRDGCVVLYVSVQYKDGMKRDAMVWYNKAGEVEQLNWEDDEDAEEWEDDEDENNYIQFGPIQ